MVILADSQLAIRQALGSGRLSENITDRPFDDYDIVLSYSHAAGSGSMPVTLHKKPGGYFALQLAPGRMMPDFSAHPQIDLRATFSINQRPPFDVVQTLATGALALVEAQTEIDGQAITYLRIAGAPFDFSTQLDPMPVALQGIVIRDNDPESPVSNVGISGTPALPDGPVTTDVNGLFFIPASPIAETVALDFNDGGTSTSVSWRPDYDRPINTLTVSLATPSP